MKRSLPLVVILGATGSGKTKLSLELARKFKGEIIGADSMQVYRGLDIITAKVTKEEYAMVPHHLIDILEPNETFTVLEFRNRAVKVINSLLEQNKLPVVVGGTNYYIESLLWKILINQPEEQVASAPCAMNKYFELSSEELHEKLKLLDHSMAKRLHPNNKRKILRSLEVLYQKGCTHSKILDEQHNTRGASSSGGGLRYQNVLIFQLKCQRAVLDDRLNNRVDNMIQQGLVQELTKFQQKYHNNCGDNINTPDFSKGVLQSIGFKEFHTYLIMTDEEKNSEQGRDELSGCIEQLKMVTRRYAKNQNKWIFNRFLGRRDREVPPIYGLDTTDVDKWHENVSQPAIEIIESFISERRCDYQPLVREDKTSTANAEDDTYHCDICDRIFVGNFQWKEHMKSNRHKKMRERKAKLFNQESS